MRSVPCICCSFHLLWLSMTDTEVPSTPLSFWHAKPKALEPSCGSWVPLDRGRTLVTQGREFVVLPQGSLFFVVLPLHSAISPSAGYCCPHLYSCSGLPVECSLQVFSNLNNSMEECMYVQGYFFMIQSYLQRFAPKGIPKPETTNFMHFCFKHL